MTRSIRTVKPRCYPTLYYCLRSSTFYPSSIPSTLLQDCLLCLNCSKQPSRFICFHGSTGRLLCHIKIKWSSCSSPDPVFCSFLFYMLWHMSVVHSENTHPMKLLHVQNTSNSFFIPLPSSFLPHFITWFPSYLQKIYKVPQLCT